MPYACRSDAKKAHRIAEVLGYGEDDWRLIVELARTMGNLPEYRRLLVRLAEALEERDVLEQPDIIAIANTEETSCST
jgi:hypothetical protein